MTEVAIRAHRGWFLHGTTLRWACGYCDFSTLTYLPKGEPDASREMADHLATFHLAELAALGYGPCARCGQMTDWLRAASAELGDTWLCEAHAPRQSLRQVLGADDVEVSTDV